MFYREFVTAKGVIEILAEVVVEGATLHLKDIAVYPRGAAKLTVGIRDVLALRQELADQVRAMGFEKLRITGVRLSGASPGKLVDISIDLK